MSERYGKCPCCNGKGYISYLKGEPIDIDPAEESHYCMTCYGTGQWGGAYSVDEWLLLPRRRVPVLDQFKHLFEKKEEEKKDV